MDNLRSYIHSNNTLFILSWANIFYKNDIGQFLISKYMLLSFHLVNFKPLNLEPHPSIITGSPPPPTAVTRFSIPKVPTVVHFLH